MLPLFDKRESGGPFVGERLSGFLLFASLFFRGEGLSHFSLLQPPASHGFYELETWELVPLSPICIPYYKSA
jgi:hypothetical protein